ncbi:hypothetical protein GOV06_04130 [Candidatus Woesearchaeota archaeon]|nr:hypothetical protein [Candidatus Woesearchaeota archaeon]
MTINKGKTNEELVQKYLARLKARKEKPVEEPNVEEPLEERVPEGGNGLLYGTTLGEIYLYRRDGGDLLVAERDGSVDAISASLTKICDAGEYDDIRSTISPVRYHSPGPNTTLYFHKARLFWAKGNKVYDESLNKEAFQRSGKINTLCEHLGSLHDGGDYSVVYGSVWINSVGANNKFFQTHAYPVDSEVHFLCSHNKELYDVRQDRSLNETAHKKNLLSFNKSVITNLCSHNGRLLVAGMWYEGGDKFTYCIRDLDADKHLVISPDEIKSMCSIQSELTNQILTERFTR